MIRFGRHMCVRPTVVSGGGICPRRRYPLTVDTPTPRYAATSDVIHHSAEGLGDSTTGPFSRAHRKTRRPTHHQRGFAALRLQSLIRDVYISALDPAEDEPHKPPAQVLNVAVAGKVGTLDLYKLEYNDQRQCDSVAPIGVPRTDPSARPPGSDS
jgi:hypothetical protein